MRIFGYIIYTANAMQSIWPKINEIAKKYPRWEVDHMQ